MMTEEPKAGFQALVTDIEDVGKTYYRETLERNATLNKGAIAQAKSIKALPPLEGPKSKRAIIVSAGPSLHRYSLLDQLKTSDFDGSIICVDGSYIKCLKAGIVPDYMLCLDPHPTRIIRWFGDPNFEENSKHDDFFNRQDLDVDFRNNSIRENEKNIEMVNEMAPQTKLLLATVAPENVVARSIEAGFDTYYWNPLVDDPNDEGSMTRMLHGINRLPCMNTGGTVGTAAWVFAKTRLKVPSLAVIGMDLGYHGDTPYEMTQLWHELNLQIEKYEGEIEDFFMPVSFPLNDKPYYTDPTYFWYRRNLLQLMEQAGGITYNCSEGGTLVGPHVECIPFADYLTGR